MIVGEALIASVNTSECCVTSSLSKVGALLKQGNARAVVVTVVASFVFCHGSCFQKGVSGGVVNAQPVALCQVAGAVVALGTVGDLHLVGFDLAGLPECLAGQVAPPECQRADPCHLLLMTAFVGQQRFVISVLGVDDDQALADAKASSEPEQAGGENNFVTHSVKHNSATPQKQARHKTLPHLKPWPMLLRIRSQTCQLCSIPALM